VGLADKLKDLTKQAQETVAEHRDQIHEAVDVAGAAADRKTRGKHSARIAKVGQKAGEAIDRFAGDGDGDGGAAPRRTPSRAD
jgi:ABC-type transporter Mla subunit MlaD